MLTEETLKEAIQEAERFLKRAKSAKPNSWWSKENGALKRSALDLGAACVAINRVGEKR
jgi:hypothetical protein